MFNREDPLARPARMDAAEREGLAIRVVHQAIVSFGGAGRAPGRRGSSRLRALGPSGFSRVVPPRRGRGPIERRPWAGSRTICLPRGRHQVWAAANLRDYTTERPSDYQL